MEKLKATIKTPTWLLPITKRTSSAEFDDTPTRKASNADDAFAKVSQTSKVRTADPLPAA